MSVVTVSLGHGTYTIHIGQRLLDDLADILAPAVSAAEFAIIADERVGRLYGAALEAKLQEGGLRASLFTFPEGEVSKTRTTWIDLSDQVAEHGLGRDGAVIALGGGVAGDLAGFVAATYQRGIPWVHVPTTLLAMTDAAIGGKTGVDTRHGKNLIGAFHQPRAVIADLATLSTLDARHFACGIAEALKHGIVTDAGYFRDVTARHREILDLDVATLETTVQRSAEIKADIVAHDPLEQGRRAHLNFGHTFGHALEAESDFELLHGEAISIGMVWEAKLAESLGIAQDVSSSIQSALVQFGLPTQPPTSIDPDRFIPLLRRDKKNRGETVRFAFPRRIGAMASGSRGEWTIGLPETTIKQFLDQYA